MSSNKPENAPGSDNNAQNNFKEAVMQNDNNSILKRRALRAKQDAAAFSAALEAARVGYWEWNIQTGELRIDQQWATITGHTLEELSPMNLERWKGLLHPDDVEHTIKSLEEKAAGKSGFCEMAIRVRHRDGGWVSVLDCGRIQLRNSNGNPLSIAGSRQAFNIPITTGSLPLDSSARELRALIENIPGTIYRIDASGKTATLSTPPEFLNTTVAKQNETTLFDTLSMVHPDDRQIVVKTHRKLKEMPQSIKISYRVVTPQNTIRWIEDHKTSIFADNGTFKSIDGILFDITDRITALEESREESRKLESHMRKSQRLETIGTLAGGIAHDFNNILTPILGYAEIGLSTIEEEEPMYEYFNEIMQAAERAQNLVSQILTFSRAQDGQASPVLIQDIIAEALKLLRASLPSTISIEQNIDSSCSNVLADPAQIHQLIINLCTNAFHTMEHTSGTLTISLQEILPSTDQAASPLHLPEKSHVRLTVSDTGSGMDEATMERMFEPFFTTKSIEKGTGLGLSVVHGIVTGAGGQITVESRKGEGTSINVYLPVIKEPKAPELPKKPQITKKEARILFIDDEPTAVQMITIMMKKLGYTIHAEKSPTEALRQFRNSSEQFEIVITDWTMPEMTGTQLAGEIHKLSPSTPIILMTGYGKVIDHDTPLSHYGICRLLKKTVKLAQLASTVNEVFTETIQSKTP